MKPVLALPAVILLLGTAACSKPEVVVEAEIVLERTGESLTLADLPIRLLPYDRDAIFDSLAAAAETPEPAITAEFQAQRDTVQAAKEYSDQAEARWGIVRDSLRALSELTQDLSRRNLRSTPQYRTAFQRFNTLDAEEDRVKQQMDAAFARFTQLQSATSGRADSLRVARETWADEAFRDFDQIVEARLEASGREELADTTGAGGMVSFEAAKGRWWVYSRYTLPYQELYWNIPIEVTGDSIHVRLTEENAELRPTL